MIKLPHSKRQEVETYCVENIGIRMYYLHNKIGGDGWSISKAWPDNFNLDISDPHMELLISLKFGA